MNAFRDGSTRILVCIDAAGMGLHIPDLKVVVQWKLSKLVTMTTLWQRLGQAGRDPRINAISIVFADSHFFLPNEQKCPEEYREFTQKVIPGDVASRNRVRHMISTFHYKDKNPSQRVKTDTAYAQ
jgi:superfamily II DNA/RNA helicase